MVWDGTGTAIVGVSHDLTTLAKAKEYLRAGDDDDALIGNLISRSSAEIETMCDRYFNTDNYADWYDGNGSKTLYLEQWPVTAVSRATSGKFAALGITCSSTTMTYASARVTSANLILVHTDSSGSTTTTLSFSTYTTMATLLAQINATGSGWAGLDMSYGTYLTADLTQTPALFCLNVYADLPHPDQALNNYLWDEDSGRLHYSGGFSLGVQNIYIEYTGGYSTIPYDLEQACLMLIASYYFGTRRDPGLSSEKLGDYAWAAKGSDGFKKDLSKRLEKYIRIAV